MTKTHNLLIFFLLIFNSWLANEYTLSYIVSYIMAVGTAWGILILLITHAILNKEMKKVGNDDVATETVRSILKPYKDIIDDKKNGELGKIADVIFYSMALAGCIYSESWIPLIVFGAAAGEDIFRPITRRILRHAKEFKEEKQNDVSTT